MIPYFRKIRKKMADDNRPLKYMRYAIGEIVLVVIGILIALSINNWNDNRLVKAESKDLLKRLIVDLEQDISYFDAQEIEYKTWLQQIDFILDQVLVIDGVKISKPEHIIAGRGSLNFLHVTQMTFIEMFNSGKKLIFKEDEIIRDINLYYQYAENELHKLNSDNEYYWEWATDTLGEEFNNGLRLYSGRNLDYNDWSWQYDPTSKEYKHIESINIYYKIAIIENIRVINSLQKKSKQLIKKISEEYIKTE